MSDKEKTHYRKAFNSPYLSSADIVEPTILTVSHVKLEIDKTKKTKDKFNTAYFSEKELRPGEPLKPMILNATNSRTMKDLTGSHFIDDWNGSPITVYVDPNVRQVGGGKGDGLRISTEKPNLQKRELTPENGEAWPNAVAAYKRDGNFDSIEKRMFISEDNKQRIKDESNVD